MPSYIRTRFWLSVTVAVVALVGTGCVERNVEPISREEAATIPPAPEPSATILQGPGDAVPTTSIAGVVEVAPELAGDVPEGATLYLIVRVAGREGGAPLAVQQIRAPSFPYSFVITEADAMIEGTPLIGEMSVTARVDQDGDAFTTSDGDLLGQTAPVVAGDDAIVVRLEERLSGRPTP